MATAAEPTLSPEEHRLIDRLVELLRNELDPEAVWLFGSRARGEAIGPESDVDIIVVAAGDMWSNCDRVYDLLFEAAQAVDANPGAISAHVYSPEWLAYRREIGSFFIREVDRDKRILFERR